MSIKADCQGFFDEYGFLSGDGNISGNGLLYTALYCMALAENKQGTVNEWRRIRILFERCEIQTGLFGRTPKNEFGQQGPDDYLGIALYALATGDRDICRRIVEYGEDNRWTFNNISPGRFTFSAWLGRQLQLKAALKIGAGFNPSWIESAVTIGVLLSGKFRKSQDGITLTYVLAKIVQRDPLLKWAGTLYLDHLQARPMEDNLNDYFGLNHPLSKHLK